MANSDDAKIDRTAGYGVPSSGPISTEPRPTKFIEVWFAATTYRLHADGNYTLWGGHPAHWLHISSTEVPIQVLNRISFELERRLAFAQLTLNHEPT